MQSMTREALLTQIKSGQKFYLVETLAESCYRHTHLPGAVQLSPFRVCQEATSVLPEKDALIVLYCSDVTCLASGTVARELESLGYRDVWVYEGGKQDWIEAGLPVEGQSRLRTAPGKL
jgi:rhodanese-related sulfurtransferase